VNDAPTNPATNHARKIMDNFRKGREAQIEHEKFLSRFPDFCYCADCKRGGNLTKYPKNEMVHMPYQAIRKGIKTTIYVHRCQEHAKRYRPQRSRNGNINE
jgi:hypothetical protein